MKRDHEIKKMEEINFRYRENKPDELSILLGCNTRLLKFKENETLEMHSHSDGDVHKFIISGEIVYNKGDEEEQTFSSGEYAIARENTVYNATASKETY